MTNILMIIVFVLGYAAITLEHKTGINKAAVALLTAVGGWTLMVFDPGQGLVMAGAGVADKLAWHLQATAQIVFFLLGAMTIVALMEGHGGFQLVAQAIRVKEKRALLGVISLITFFLSAILDNLTTSIVMVTLLFRLVHDKEDRLIFASMIIIAANAGGAWSAIGDVTTTMLWIGGRVSALRIMEMLLVPSLLSMIVPLVYFSCVMKKGLVLVPVETLNTAKVLLPGAKRIFFLGMGALVFVPVFKSMTGLPPVVGVLLGLGVLWLVTDRMHDQARGHLKVPAALARIDVSSILFFLGILLAVAALDTAGILSQLALWMDQHLGNKDVIATVLGLMSAVIDNVPLTAATMAMYDVARYPMDAKLWELLAYSVGTGGSILIIGSAAGVVVMGMARINFFWYLRKVSFPALLGYGAGIGAYLIIYRFFVQG